MFLLITSVSYGAVTLKFYPGEVTGAKGQKKLGFQFIRCPTCPERCDLAVESA